MDHLLAAVDLGSNSFRLSIGKVVQHDNIAQIYAIDNMKESVRLAAGLDESKRLDEPTIERALAVLRRFRERLDGFHPNRVRAVATNTFRVARNAPEILPRAEAALGFPIEVIAGQEEARLIFSGVANELRPSDQRRLVIDIGGGSTEIIIGKGFEPLHMASLYMGCVSYTQRFFAGGVITEERLLDAELTARQKLEGIARQYRKTGWQEAYGSSGTAKGLIAVLTDGGMSKSGITLEGLMLLRERLIRDGRVRLENLPGLREDRAPVLAGGLAIMIAAFKELSIDRMAAGDGALRVGVLYDLLGRDSAHDKRDETVRQFIRRYHVDTRQALRVRTLALEFFRQTELPDCPEKQELVRTLGWAADMHEIGLSIAHADYHKHGAYILEHADMPGFSNDDQVLLATLVLGHQGKLNKLRAREPTRAGWMALLSLRMAVLLSRRREGPSAVPVRLELDHQTIRAHVRTSWLATHALTEYALQRELREWNRTDFLFEVVPA
ncbi:MAG TPA: exopolyphosphatase [Burkholderiaceae bacterium]|nr:exopolyphosphatase [Burkholderiaceae bacterium]